MLTEPEGPMLRRLRRRAEREALRAGVVRAAAEDLPFDDGAFDVVVTTLVLCCGCNRRTLDAIRAAGFEVAALERPALPDLPSLVSPLVAGTAAAPADARVP